MSVDFQAINEAARRRMGQVQSSAGLQGGAPSTQQMSSPIHQMAMNRMQQPQQSQAMPRAGDAQNPTAGAQQMMQKAAPGEAEMIIKALSSRLNKLQ